MPEAPPVIAIIRDSTDAIIREDALSGVCWCAGGIIGYRPLGIFQRKPCPHERLYAVHGRNFLSPDGVLVSHHSFVIPPCFD